MSYVDSLPSLRYNKVTFITNIVKIAWKVGRRYRESTYSSRKNRLLKEIISLNQGQRPRTCTPTILKQIKIFFFSTIQRFWLVEQKYCSEHIRGSVKVAPIASRLRLYGYVMRRPDNHVMKKCLSIPTQKRGRGRTQTTWMKNV